MAGAALRIRKKSIAPQATTFRPYNVMRNPVGVLKKRQKATRPVMMVCFHVLGVSGSVVGSVELSMRGSNDFWSGVTTDDSGERFGNVAARLLSPGFGAASLVARCPSLSKSMLFSRRSVRFGACAIALPVAAHIPGCGS